jgi:DNA modification methylase
MNGESMNGIKVLCGDVIDQLKTLSDESIQCVVTSPPYWGLRDYSVCGCSLTYNTKNLSEDERLSCSEAGGGLTEKSCQKKKPNPNCLMCKGTGTIDGIKNNQFGSEKSPDEYVEHLLETFREVWRVLRNDGTVWLNLGDSYYNYRPGGDALEPQTISGKKQRDYPTSVPRRNLSQRGLKEKDLVGIPWRVALALQNDGWYLRSDVIWNKSNPMPESVTDRPTRSHEYIFLLTKSPHYYYDQEAIREPYTEPLNRWGGKTKRASPEDSKVWTEEGKKAGFTGLARRDTNCRPNPAGRNRRTVWEMRTKPYTDAHFATFPEELPERCILAGTSQKGACPVCGAPWKRILKVDRSSTGMERWDELENDLSDKAKLDTDHNRKNISGIFKFAGGTTRETTGWQPTCECGHNEVVPCTVMDIFAGSGTTGAVAQRLGRKAILIELNPEYIKLINKRCNLGYADITETYL